MDFAPINTGTFANDGTGDNIRAAADKTNQNGLQFTNHVNITHGNPHGTQAHDVGAYTQAEVDQKLAGLGTLSDLILTKGQIDTAAVATKTASDAALAARDTVVPLAAQVAADRAAVTPLAAQVAADRVQTGQDRVQTGLDRAAVASNLAAVAGGPVGSINGKTGAIVFLDPLDASSVPPTLDLPLTVSDCIPAAWFSRLSAGARLRASGLLESVVAGVLRIDHDPLTGANLGALIEAAATNLWSWSEQFDNVAWTKSGATAAANVAAAPDGTLTADKLVESTANGSHLLLQAATGTATSVHAMSVFARAAERSKIMLQLDNASTVGGTAVFDLLAGTVSGVSGSGSPVPFMQALPGGLYRIGLSAIPGTGTTVRGVMYLHNGTTTSYTGDGASGLHLWGGQLEPGSAWTSYIATMSAAVTRAADFLSIPVSADWFNPVEGTVFYEGILTASGFLWLFDSGGGSNLLYASANPGIMQVACIAGGVSTTLNLTPPAVGTRFRLAVACAAGSLRASVNGGAVVSAAPAAVPSGLTTLNIGAFGRANTGFLGGTGQRPAYVPRALSSTVLQRMSAL